MGFGCGLMLLSVACIIIIMGVAMILVWLEGG